MSARRMPGMPGRRGRDVFLAAMLAALLTACAAAPLSVARLSLGFYVKSCPRAEAIVASRVRVWLTKQPNNAGALLRLLFHDCFVRGCDASLLLDSIPGAFGEGDDLSAEKDSPSNLNVRGYLIIDDIKRQLELACPRTVSCADVIALASRDAVRGAGGPFIAMKTGRRDGTASFALDASTLPSFTDIPTLIRQFAQLGFTSADLVALSGAHTIGISHCLNLRERLTFTTERATMNQSFADSLTRTCGKGSLFKTMATLVNDVTTPNVFDNQYYKNLQQRKGLFSTDQALTDFKGTAMHVNKFAGDQVAFFKAFSSALLRMSEISVLTGRAGEVRTNCHVATKRQLTP